MVTYFRDITSTETESIFSPSLYHELDSFFGIATCINVSRITTYGVLDLHNLKELLSSRSIDISKYRIVMLYTGHHDRYYNTSNWNRSKPFITYSAISYLASLGVKSICIDSPSPFGEFPIPMDTGLNFVLALCNLGHLCGKELIYMGFPVKVNHLQKKYFLRALALEAIL